MDSQPRLLLGVLDGPHLIVQPTRRAHPNADDYWDGNWLLAAIRVLCGGRRLEYEASLRAEEFVAFHAGVRRLLNHPEGTAGFKTMERWLRIHIHGDGQGHFRADCGATGRPGLDRQIDFTFDVDRAALPPVVSGLDAIVAAFPVRGTLSP